ncbi:MAG: alpha/beta fold hydrolase [Holosporales bacterium]|nr:alpha/beta fold hydrolase [Holosporales bacterium]
MIQNYEIVRSEEFDKPERIAVILHGYGSTGGDFAEVGKLYLSKALENTVFVFPDAPYECDGQGGRRWFTLNKMTYEELRDGLDDVAAHVHQFILNISQEYDCNDVSVSGFSQGAMVALEMGYYSGISKIIAYSGMFVTNASGKYDTNTEVLIAHSDDDMVIPYQNATAAVRLLTSSGVSVTLKTCHNIGHTISVDGWNAGIEFLVSGNFHS